MELRYLQLHRVLGKSRWKEKISFVNINCRFNTAAPPYLWRCGSRTSVQSLSRVWLFATPWTAARQAPLSSTNSRSLLKLKSIELVMPSNHLTLCCPLLLLPSIFPSSRVFSNEPVLLIRWPGFQGIPKSADAQALIKGDVILALIPNSI